MNNPIYVVMGCTASVDVDGEHLEESKWIERAYRNRVDALRYTEMINPLAALLNSTGKRSENEWFRIVNVYSVHEVEFIENLSIGF